jgi:hypothetical protein
MPGRQACEGLELRRTLLELGTLEAAGAQTERRGGEVDKSRDVDRRPRSGEWRQRRPGPARSPTRPWSYLWIRRRRELKEMREGERN